MSDSLWLDQAVGHHVVGDLDKADAFALTAKIKSYVGVTWILIAAAHERRAHKAMGYATWGEYVEAEFDMSRSRSYQLISQAKVVLEITEAMSSDDDGDLVSTMVDISERQARDLGGVLDEAKVVAAEAVEMAPGGATPEEKADRVTEALDRLRDTAVAAQRKSVAGGASIREDEEPDSDEAHGAAPEPGPVTPPAPSPEDAGLANLAEKVANSDDGYRLKVSSAQLQVRRGLLLLDPDRTVATCQPDDRPDLIAFARDLSEWCLAVSQGLDAGTKLRSVK